MMIGIGTKKDGSGDQGLLIMLSTEDIGTLLQGGAIEAEKSAQLPYSLTVGHTNESPESLGQFIHDASRVN